MKYIGCKNVSGEEMVNRRECINNLDFMTQSDAILDIIHHKLIIN